MILAEEAVNTAMRKANGWYIAIVPAPMTEKLWESWRPCVEWCRENFGDRAIDGWRFNGYGEFEFREESQYLLFLLRWA